MIPSRLIWDGRTLSRTYGSPGRRFRADPRCSLRARVLPPLGPAIERYGSAVWPGGSFSVGAA